MLPATKWLCLIGGVYAGTLLASGCGGTAAPEPTASKADGQPTLLQTAGKKLPAASIGAANRGGSQAEDDMDDEDPDLAGEKDSDVKLEPPKEGTPEWLVHEATKIRLQPPPATEDVTELRASRKQRNEKIVALCQQAVALTHKDPKRERLLSVAVHQLLEARVQLALMGDRADIDALYEDAAALQTRDPQSQAAAEGAYALVNFAYSHAKTSAKVDPRWLQEFARQAIHYASSFPKEEHRSLPLLFTAARSCELHGLQEEATQCYTLIKKQFPKSPYAKRVSGILRRLSLPGQHAQLSGPTLAGGNVAVDDLAGRVVLVVFWSTEAKQFQVQLPALQETQRKYAKQGLAIIGVNLDQDPAPVNQFLVANKISWPQIFFPESEKRGWNNPVASFYGVMEIPALWLIDQQGVVVSTTVAAAELDASVRKLLQK